MRSFLWSSSLCGASTSHLMSRGVVEAVLKMADYAKPLEEKGKVLSRYHIPGAHGRATTSPLSKYSVVPKPIKNKIRAASAVGRTQVRSLLVAARS